MISRARRGISEMSLKRMEGKKNMIYTSDSIEAIAQDARALMRRYANRERYPFSGCVQLLDDAVAHRVYLMGWIILFKRIEAVTEGKKT